MDKKRLICLIILSIVVLFACSKDDNPLSQPEPASPDREKFIGEWAGTYECTSFSGDTIIINKGTGDLDVLVSLHVFSFIDSADLEFNSGNLTGINVITIPEQKIAGFDGSAEIKYSSNTLSLVQRGFGLTCNGSNYIKIE
jgi:hypothetical protein